MRESGTIHVLRSKYVRICSGGAFAITEDGMGCYIIRGERMAQPGRARESAKRFADGVFPTPEKLSLRCHLATDCPKSVCTADVMVP